MEELDPRPTVCETAWKAPRRAYIGFTIFDAIHIICGIVLIVLGCRSNPIDAFAIAEHSVIILLSILLIAYIAALAKPSHDHDAFHGAYTYAWLVATAGIIVPSLFSIPYIAMGEWEFSVYAAIGLEVAALVVAAIIFAIFFLVLFNYRKQKFWRRAIWLPLSLIILLSILLFVSEFFVDVSVEERVFDCVEDLAPIIPAVLGFTMFRNKGFCE